MFLFLGQLWSSLDRKVLPYFSNLFLALRLIFGFRFIFTIRVSQRQIVKRMVLEVNRYKMPVYKGYKLELKMVIRWHSLLLGPLGRLKPALVTVTQCYLHRPLPATSQVLGFTLYRSKCNRTLENLIWRNLISSG